MTPLGDRELESGLEEEEESPAGGVADEIGCKAAVKRGERFRIGSHGSEKGNGRRADSLRGGTAIDCSLH